jgi:hypothetical protein
MVSQIDFIASFAAHLGLGIPEGHAIDSRDTMDAFLGKDPEGLPFMVEEAKTLALREGPWKFILKDKPNGKDELYNLAKDIGERKNVIADHRGRAGEMRAKLLRIKEAGGGIRSLK